MTDNLEDSNINMKNIYASPKKINLKFDLFEKNDVICEDYNENLLDKDVKKKSFLLLSANKFDIRKFVFYYYYYFLVEKVYLLN